MQNEEVERKKNKGMKDPRILPQITQIPPHFVQEKGWRGD